jgi:TatD family-associated radical SAM protein
MDAQHHTLWLEREPALEEVLEEFSKFPMEKYEEVVFCGFGEPTERLDVLLQVAAFVKKTYQKPIRLNTNGQADLIWSRDVTPQLQGLVDTISISLNTPDAKKYQELVRSRFGEQSYEAMLTFAKNAAKYVPKVVMTTVETTLTKEEEEACRRLCEQLGVTYRIRAWEGNQSEEKGESEERK